MTDRPAYHLTETAQEHFEKIILYTARRWDWRQAETYRDALLQGFQYIAANHHRLTSPHRRKLAMGTAFCLHLVEHHYVCFTVHNNRDVIITGLLHEGMNIPLRLKELQEMSRDQIAALEVEIGLQPGS